MCMLICVKACTYVWRHARTLTNKHKYTNKVLSHIHIDIGRCTHTYRENVWVLCGDEKSTGSMCMNMYIYSQKSTNTQLVSSHIYMLLWGDERIWQIPLEGLLWNPPNFTVRIQIKRKFQFEFEPQYTDKSEFLDTVDILGVMYCSVLQCVAVCCSVLQCVSRYGGYWECSTFSGNCHM
jgi:hypothetical protein